MDVNELTETAGKVGASFAESLAQKAIEAIDGFPTVGPNADEQTAAVTRLVVRELEGYAEEKEG